MNRNLTSTLIAGLAAIALGAGCGSESGAGTEATDTTVSPLAQLLGYQNETPEESRRKQLEAENLIAECMREEGWEYIPVDWAAQESSQGEPDELWGTEAFGKKYGYGVVYNYEQYEEPGLLNPDQAHKVDPSADPNQDYVQSLTEAEQAQYQESLYGPMSAEFGGPTVEAQTEDSTIEAQQMIEVQGCNGTAYEEVYGSTDPTRDNPDLAARVEEYYTAQQDDPRLQAANEAWAACLAAKVGDIDIAGSPLKKPTDMYQYVDNLKYEAMGLERVPWDGTKEIENMWTGSTNEDGTGYAYVGQPHVIAEDDLERLRVTELDLWAKDYGCGKDARLLEIQAEVEQDFVEQLRSEFPELGSGT